VSGTVAAMRAFLPLVWLVLVSGFASARAESDAVRAVNEFGLACQRQMEGNALISPWSLQQALAMSYAGARGKTQAEMARALSYRGTPENLHEAFKALRESLERAAAKRGGESSLHLANRVFLAPTARTLPTWQALVKRCYASEPTTLASDDPEKIVAEINAWVSRETRGKIPVLLEKGSIPRPPLFELALVSALHLHEVWEEQFTKELTQAQPFYLDAKRQKVVPLMFKQHRMRYAQRPGFQIAALPYAGGAFQFVAIVPEAVDGLAAVESQLTPDLLLACSTLSPAEVRLWLPRLNLQPPVHRMKPVLQRLGMKAAFSNEADFHAMSPANVEIDDVYHRTFLELDEDGVTAAAATAVIHVTKNGHPHATPHRMVTADRPFFFLVQHIASGACLFIGRVTDPAPDTGAADVKSGVRQPALPSLPEPQSRRAPLIPGLPPIPDPKK
jgi:serpin B